MVQKSANINVEGETLSVVVLPPPVKLKGEWLFLFRQSLVEASEELSPSAKAVLLDLLTNGAVSVYGLIMGSPSLLQLHGLSRTSVYRGVSALEKRNIIARSKRGVLYVNPQVAYRGASRDWGKAMSYWESVRVETKDKEE